jgi:hypothetical protein
MADKAMQIKDEKEEQRLHRATEGDEQLHKYMEDLTAKAESNAWYKVCDSSVNCTAPYFV